MNLKASIARRSLCLLVIAGCMPAAQPPPPAYAPRAAAGQPTRGLAIRGRVPRGARVDHIVAIQVDVRTGKRQRIRVRPAADGSYQLQLPRGHRYAMAYEAGGRMVGKVAFPGPRGQPTQTINVSQNVVITNQSQYVDLGDTSYVNGAFVAASDPYAYLDSDGDGVVDDQDADPGVDLADDGDVVAEQQAFEGEGDFADVDEDADSEQAP
jgi:hypothetical protein